MRSRVRLTHEYSPIKAGGALSRPAARAGDTPRALPLDLDLGEIDLVEQVDLEGVLDRLPLEVRVRDVPERDERQRAFLARQLLLELLVDRVPLGVVRRLLRLGYQGVVLLVAVARVVVARVARPQLEEVDVVDKVADPTQPVDVDGLGRRRSEELQELLPLEDLDRRVDPDLLPHALERLCDFLVGRALVGVNRDLRSEEHTSELQSHSDLVCRLLLEKKKRRAVHFTMRTKKYYSIKDIH